MKKEKKISRRNFLKIVSYSAALPSLFLWMKSAQGKIAAAGKREIVLPLAGIADGITFRDSVIFNKEDEKLKIFSSSCTHLGCKISSFKNGELICPCHGSRFDGNGNVVNGPALNPLKEIRYSIDRKKETVRFYV